MSSVPSFSSFPVLPEEDNKRHDRQRKKHKRGDKVKDNNRRKEQTIESSKPDEGPLLFYTDTKGDTLNIRYGGLNQHDIPRHSLCARGKQVLGLPSALSVLHRSGKGVEIGFTHYRKKPQLSDASSRALLAAPPTRSLVGTSSQKYEEIEGFIRLPSRLGNRGNDQAYRSITQTEANSDSESSGTDDQIALSSDDEQVARPQSHVAVLNQRIEKNPESVETWLAILSHSLSTIPLTSKNALKARSDITLSVLSRALSAHTSNRRSKILRLKYIAAGEELWPYSKLTAEWEDLLLDLEAVEPDIWLEWLDWKIKQAVQGVDPIFEDAKRALVSIEKSQVDEKFKVRVLWRIAVMLQSAGFTERATALFQAQVEFTFNMPETLKGKTTEECLDAMEVFWESEVARVGEKDAKGWADSNDADPLEVNPGPSIPAEPEPLDSYIRWSQHEFNEDQKNQLPSRSTDAAAELDPYSTVLFSDLRPIIFPYRTEKGKDALRFAYLSFLGLHIPGLSQLGIADDRWCNTHLVSPQSLAQILPIHAEKTRITTDSFSGVTIGRERDYSNGFGPVKAWGCGVVDILQSSFDARNSGPALWSKEDLAHVNVPLIRNIFSQLRTGTSEEWDMYALAFEAVFSLKSAVKLSRSFLSTARNSLPHWFAHAELEKLRNRPDEARKVYQAVLVGPMTATQSWPVRLWWHWAEMEWLSGDSDAALRVIFKSAGVEGSGGVAVLRAKSYIHGLLDTTDAAFKVREACIQLLALLELLAAGSISDALIVFDVNAPAEGTIAHESLVVASLLMVYRHGAVLKNATPPAILRERASRALEQYNNNTILLGFFLEAEKGQGVWGRVRNILGNGAGSDSKSVARRAADVWISSWEEGRWQAEVERTRSGLANAVVHTRTRGPILWRIYIEMEIRAGELQKAKTLLYLMIGQYPLNKDFYLLAFQPALRSVFSPAELNSIADSMVERGLRLRRGLDEIVEGGEHNKVGENDEDSGISDDGIEYSALELRRLRPY